MLAALLLTAHGGGLALLALLPLVWWVRVLLGGALLCSLWLTLNQHALRRGKRTITALVWGSDDNWLLKRASGTEHRAQLKPGSYVSPRLVILNFDAGRWPRSVVLLPDAADAESLRKLRVRLQTL
ncbi:MAG: hypothetical protein C4528_08075 [Gammaproteobacteria bacterium]|nr:MAG: hypothetical protein C4528_08075 [Gammaproteobacteria bacterium]